MLMACYPPLWMNYSLLIVLYMSIIQDRAICYTPIGDILIFPIDLFIMLVHVYGMLYLPNLM